ncbi:mitochondrial carrier domain-containing protein [Aspergillus carlsbadensis]|nr:mitochondrial carrier domain-containing protein [Aspergillus carlsbadensis]
MSQKQPPSPWQSILAGGAAGGFESLLTYPTEYLKTRQQLQAVSSGKPLNPAALLVQTIRQHGLRHIYTGSAAFCLSNAGKSGVRFFTFDTARQWMPIDRSGKTTAWGNLCAGMIAGTAESVLVVTPGETLKTKIIDDQSGPKRYTSASHAVRSVISAEGVSGLYRGVVPVTLKQSANAMVRFTSYNFFLGQLQTLASNESPVTGSTAIAGAMAGIVTVYATMPFDTIKTCLQALDGRQRYAGTFDCLWSIISREGVSVLWRGTTPRLARLSISGAVSFSIYEQVIQWTSSFDCASTKGKLGM